MVPQLNIRKQLVFTNQENQFFKTGVDVEEEYVFEGTAQDAEEQFKLGNLTAEQIRELL